MKTAIFFQKLLTFFFICTAINATAWPIDSVYWNKSVTPHTLYVKLTKDYATRHLWGQVKFNLTKDTLIAEYHFLQCFGPAAVLPWDTTFILTSSVDTPLYHLAVREYWDTSTVTLGCYDTVPAMAELYIGYSGSVGLSVYEQIQLLSLYPNPTSSVLHINPNYGVEVYQLKLLNSLGQRMNINSNDSMKSINISHLPKGLYLLRIETSRGVISRRIQKE